MSGTFFWNVRGLNEPSKHSPLSSWLNSKPVTFGALLETHVKEASKHNILSAIGSDWKLLDNYLHSDLGKIWVIYKEPTKVRVLFVDLQSITCEIVLEGGIEFIYTAIYASNDEDQRLELWTSLRDTSASFGFQGKPWIVNGDFNEILHPDETSNANIFRTTSPMRCFGDCLTDLGLFDLPWSGSRFTWQNNRPSGPVGKKLDRCLVNGDWLLKFPSSHCLFEAPLFSDHSPGFISVCSDPPKFGTRPFKFYNLLLKHPLFLDFVDQAWAMVGLNAVSLKDFGFKLKQLKRPLKSLYKDNYSDIEKRVAAAQEDLSFKQLLALDHPSSLNIQNEVLARELWFSLRVAVDSFYRQRSRIRWYGEGDLNIPFYHRVTTTRNAGNAIKFLIRQDGSSTSSLEEVHQLATDHFQSVLSTIRGSFCPDLPDYLDELILIKCSSTQRSSFLTPFLDEDIQSNLFKMPSNRTPGPDGFPVEFFKGAWPIIGAEVLASVKDFFQHSFMPTSLNATSLILLAKRPGANSIQEYRPIACLNTQYKLVTRLLSNRLKTTLPGLILPNQTAFVADRLLVENVLLASELVQGYHKITEAPKITLKVDIAKAFDSVRWDFLLSVLAAYDIPHEFIAWIKTCVCSPSFSLSINGVSSGYFKSKTGLRQGDPLSPILFIMMMNILSLMLNRAAAAGSFNYHQDCDQMKLTHLCFADDLLIFLEGSENSLNGVLHVLAEFEKMSGLSVNISKTSMFSCGVSEDKLERFNTVFGLSQAKLPIRYLGLPLSSKKLSIKDYDPLLLQIKKKLGSWTSKTLTMAGRLTLISSVIAGITGFWMSAFLLPKGVMRKINSLCSSFLWHGTIGISTGAKVAWEDLSTPKNEGGLGLRDLKVCNETCILKLLWMIFFKSGSLWVAWIRNRYISSSSFWALNERNYTYSWIFRKILSLRPKALRFLKIQVCSGDSTFFWWDPWTPFGPLADFLDSDGTLGIPISSTVADLKTDEGWLLPNARSDKQVQLLAFLSTMVFQPGCDYPTWSIGNKIYKSFSSKVVSNAIRFHRPLQSWAPLIWHKAMVHKHATTTWLFTLNRNPTRDRLSSWDPDSLVICLLCGNQNESRDHLFFQCNFSSAIWRSIMRRLDIQNYPTAWTDILHWLPNAHRDNWKRLGLLQAWQAAIYEIWRERNRRLHDGLTFPPSKVFKAIIFGLRDKCSSMNVQGNPRGPLLAQFWYDPP